MLRLEGRFPRHLVPASAGEAGEAGEAGDTGEVGEPGVTGEPGDELHSSRISSLSASD